MTTRINSHGWMFPLKAIFNPFRTTTMTARPASMAVPVVKISPPADAVSPSQGNINE